MPDAPSNGTTRFIFVTGGVVSSLGKGIAAASIGRLLVARGLKVQLQKLDPYINVDPGTMSPVPARRSVRHRRRRRDRPRPRPLRALHRRQHAPRHQLHDRRDLRVGHHEGAPRRLPRRDRAGDPAHHRRDQALHQARRRRRATSTSSSSRSAARSATSSRCRSSRRSASSRSTVGRRNCMFIHLTLVPYIGHAGELKTKPTQHSVKELRRIGIQPDMLMCRSEEPLADGHPQEDRAVHERCRARRSSRRATSTPSTRCRSLPRPAGRRHRARPLRHGGAARRPDRVGGARRRAPSRRREPVTIALVGKYVELAGRLHVADRGAAPRRHRARRQGRGRLDRLRAPRRRRRRPRRLASAATASWSRAASASAASRARSPPRASRASRASRTSASASACRSRSSSSRATSPAWRAPTRPSSTPRRRTP